jgi:hypothetical protein
LPLVGSRDIDDGWLDGRFGATTVLAASTRKGDPKAALCGGSV